MHPLDWIDDELEGLKWGHLLRERIASVRQRPAVITVDGRDLINFGTNDYLALASDPRLAEAVGHAMQGHGWGAGASPLLAGYSLHHQQLEQRLADFMGTEAALVFTSGYAANVGTVAALADRPDVIFSDEKNHASLIDGCRLSRATIRVYPHGDARALERMLRESTCYRRRLIVTEGVFSMDGDLAPLCDLAELSEAYGAMLLVDEAHAIGVFGSRGCGVAEHLGTSDAVHVTVGTLSKTFGSSGGFVCGRRRLIDWLVNTSRSYVFSTAPPAAVCAAAAAAVDIVREEPGRGQQLLAEAERLRQGLRAGGWQTGASASQIVPVVVGDATIATDLAAALRERGLYVPAIRPPSVAAGEARLRISLSVAHTTEMIDRLIAAMSEIASTAAARTAHS